MTTENTAAETTAATESADTAITTPEAATEQPTGEGQGDGDTPAANEETAEAATEEAQGAPEAYEAFTLPEGFVLEGERATQAEAYFRANNMTQAQAQDAIDLFVKLNGENIASLEAQRVQRIEEWGQQSRERFGDAFEQMASDARRGVTAMKTPALLDAFEEHGWGNHPELVAVFAKLGQLTGDDKPAGLETETASIPADAPIEARMYPGMARSR